MRPVKPPEKTTLIIVTTESKRVGDVVKIVYILDKSKADYLKSLGFKYNETEIAGTKGYQFIGTDELIKSLNSNFEKSDFLVRENMCF